MRLYRKRIRLLLRESPRSTRLIHPREQLKSNPAMLRSLMQSQDGQMLLRMLTQGDSGVGLQRAVQAAAKGNTAEMVQMVSQVMKSPEGAALVQRINRTVQK